MSINENASVHISRVGFSDNYYRWISDVFAFMSSTVHSGIPGFALPHNVLQVKIVLSSNGKWFLYTNPHIKPSSISEYFRMWRLEINRKSRRPVSIYDMETAIKAFQSRNNFCTDFCRGNTGFYSCTIEKKL
jgi:hypothetical protein